MGIAAVAAFVLVLLGTFGSASMRRAVWCLGKPQITNNEEALKAAIPVAKLYYSKLFDRLSIDTEDQLRAAYPECCSVSHPGGDEFYWFVDIEVKSPCTGRNFTMTVDLDVCGGHGSTYNVGSVEDACR